MMIHQGSEWTGRVFQPRSEISDMSYYHHSRWIEILIIATSSRLRHATVHILHIYCEYHMNSKIFQATKKVGRGADLSSEIDQSPHHAVAALLSVAAEFTVRPGVYLLVR